MSAYKRRQSPTNLRSRGNIALLALALAAVLATGCLKEILFFGYLVGGPPSVEPDFDKETKKSLTDHGVRVAVVCYAPTKLKLLDEKVDEVIAKHVAYKLRQNQIMVIRPALVQEWLDEHPEWETPVEIGEAFKTKYVIFIDLQKYSLYEKGSQTLMRGRAEAVLTVWELDDMGDGERIYRREVKSVYPLAVPRSTYETSYSKFRKEFLDRVSRDIGWKFYERYNGEDMQDAM